MERKQFFKNMGLAGLALTGFRVLNSCSNDDDSITGDTSGSTDTGGGTDSGSGSGTGGGGTANCIVAPSETEGPFPTKTPSSLVRSDITSDRTGVPFNIDIIIQNVNDDCNVLEGAIVDIWHCDKDGNYSEYGGTGMQQTDYTSVHFLRGRQTTNADGQVAFTSIFPGWYTSRATHIHVHVYNESGNSLLVTQIAFPESSDSAVVQVNASTENGYTKGMSGYTYNANDNVFSDDTDGVEIGAITGSLSEGFTITQTIKVSA